ncbi:P-type ATPase [Spraguea lophii 42_110]|uniref:Cation-transporting ATPase n=1 Tax=Spraguea lophii (strain 42_110) TaxID=1358809 RepID=S7WD51_SPRLO|nr:P-type ATPase [Spraguea lophii 42_110]
MKIEETISLEGRKKCIGREIMYYIICTLSFGIIPFILKNKHHIRIRLRTIPTRLRNAQYVIAENQYKDIEVKKIEEIHVNEEMKNDINLLDRHIQNFTVRVVSVFYRRLIFDFVDDLFHYPEEGKNHNLNIILNELSEENVICTDDGILTVSAYESSIMYGKNATEVQCPTILEIFLDNIFSVFVFYTLACIIVWININYKLYASAIFITTLIILYGEIDGDIEARKSKIDLGGKSDMIYVLRRRIRPKQNTIGIEWVKVDSENVYPGDLVLVEEGKIFNCDVKLCDGEAVVEESFLTGESTPVYKIMGKEKSGAMVFSGTKVIMSKSYGRLYGDSYFKENEKLILPPGEKFPAVGVVVSTGFKTVRGEMIRNILVSGAGDNQFYMDCFKLICTLIILGVILSIFTFLYFYLKGIPINTSFVYIFDLFASLIAPVLPVSMKLGLSVTLKRLRNKGIICNEPERINLTGKCDIAIFDKTGTLTENELELKYLDSIDDVLTKKCPVRDDIVKYGLSTCHTLIKVEDNVMGDGMEIKMLEMANAELTDKKSVIITSDFDNTEIELKMLEVHEFNSKIMRMSVKVSDGKQTYLFCKGSAESIKGLLSEIPDEYQYTVEKYAKNGYRVLAMAYKKITEDNTKNNLLMDKEKIRKHNENELTFLAFLVFVNKLKENTTNVITELKKAGIRTIISTGDNMLTAIAVAKECGIIGDLTKKANDQGKVHPFIKNEDSAELSHENSRYNIYEVTANDNIAYNPLDKDEECSDVVYCVDGKHYENIREEKEIKEVLRKGVIFSRMNPTQKALLVEDLKKHLEYTTTFCGDGANDCGAIRASDVGITISENEATVTSPFVSSIPNISSVKSIISDGRAAMINSLSNFKFIIITSLTQYITLTLLSVCFSFLSDIQTLHYDIALVFPSTLIMTSILPSKNISDKKVKGLLFYMPQIFIMVFINALFVFIATLIFVPNLIKNNLKFEGSFETQATISTVLFFLTSIQCIILSIFLIEGKPHRKNKWKFKSFIIHIIISPLIISLLFILNLQRIRNLDNKIINYILNLYEFEIIPLNKIKYLGIIIICNGIVLFLGDLFIKNYIEKWMSNKEEKEIKRRREDDSLIDEDMRRMTMYSIIVNREMGLNSHR